MIVRQIALMWFPMKCNQFNIIQYSMLNTCLMFNGDWLMSQNIRYRHQINNLIFIRHLVQSNCSTLTIHSININNSLK